MSSQCQRRYARVPDVGLPRYDSWVDTTPTRAPSPAQPSLWRRSVTSTSLTLAANVIAIALILVRAILLARWLPIEVFGVYVMASASVELSSIVADLGLGEAFLHRAPETEDENHAAATHLTLKLVLLTGWALLAVAIASVVCRGELMVAMLVLVGTTVALHLTQTPRVLLIRQVLHGRLALLQIVTAVVGTGVALTLAAAGAELWALLSIDLVTAGVAIAGLYLWRPVWRPRLAWSRARVRYFLGFGGKSFAATLLLRGIERLDDLWTGIFLGDAALGLYSRAFGFATFPRRLVSNPVSEVLGGTYAELKEDRPRLSTAFLVSNSALMRVCFPLAAGMVLVAPELVGTLLGERWLPMVPAFQLLAVFTLLDPLRYSIAGLFTAVGRPDHAITARLLQVVVLCIGLTTLGPALGIAGVALAVTISALTGAVIMTTLAKRYVDFPLIRMVGPPLVGVVAGSGLSLALKRSATVQGWALPVLELLILVVAYAAVLVVLDRRQLHNALAFIKEFTSTGASPIRTGPWSVLVRNVLELTHLIGDCAPRFLVSGESYRRLRRLLSRTPQRYESMAEKEQPFTQGAWRERKFVSSSTDVCVEAFPGSGSSFVSNSLRMAVDRPANIESHFHQTVQLKRALGLGVPVIVLVRDPAGACASLKSKDPRLAEWIILLRWIHYHRWLARHLDTLDVFLFDDLIADVDILRRQSRAVASLVSGPIVPHPEFRRASKCPMPIDDRRSLNRALLDRASAVYQEIEIGCDGRSSDPVDTEI